MFWCALLLNLALACSVTSKEVAQGLVVSSICDSETFCPIVYVLFYSSPGSSRGANFPASFLHIEALYFISPGFWHYWVRFNAFMFYYGIKNDAVKRVLSVSTDLSSTRIPLLIHHICIIADYVLAKLLLSFWLSVKCWSIIRNLSPWWDSLCSNPFCCTSMHIHWKWTIDLSSDDWSTVQTFLVVQTSSLNKARCVGYGPNLLVQTGTVYSYYGVHMIMGFFYSYRRMHWKQTNVLLLGSIVNICHQGLWFLKEELRIMQYTTKTEFKSSEEHMHSWCCGIHTISGLDFAVKTYIIPKLKALMSFTTNLYSLGLISHLLYCLCNQWKLLRLVQYLLQGSTFRGFKGSQIATLNLCSSMVL